MSDTPIATLWNKLGHQERFALLTKANYEKGWEIRCYEMKLKWNKLLPSTQQELERLAELKVKP